MLEEMLGDDHPRPGPHPPGRKQDHRRDRDREDEADLADPDPIAADRLERTARGHHQDQVAEDSDQRQGLKGRCAGQMHPPARVAAAGEREQGHQHREDGAAHRIEVVDRAAGQPADRIEMKIVGPHARERDHRQADSPAAFVSRLAVEIVDEDE